MLRNILLPLMLFCGACALQAQEIEARVTVNHQKVEQTSSSVFEALETQLKDFINDRQWTNMQFRNNERIQVNFNFTVNKYTETDYKFTCSLYVQASRPVWGSTYTTTVFSIQDNNASFTFQEFDKLEFRADVIDNELTALVAYYIYIIIGMDCDAMSPLGGTDAFTTAQTIVNNAQTFGGKGWKAFEDDKNRYAIVNDLLDSGMEPFRRLQYKYYREGLDVMSENTERGRAAITEAINMLKQAKETKPLSALPVLFTEYKGDEIVSIYKDKAATKEKQEVHEILTNINPSKNTEWNKLR